MGNLVDAKSKDGIGVKGFVQIELVNEEKGSRQTFSYNTVTKLGKKEFLARAAGSILCQPSLVERGNLFGFGSFGLPRRSSSEPGYMYPDENSKALTMYLINSENALSEDSLLLPVYNADMSIDNSKVVGYASYNRVSANAKQGVIENPKSSYVIDDTIVSQRWKFDTSQGNGTFNKICIGAGVLTDRYGGVSLFKGLDGLPSDLTNNFKRTGYMCRPGVTGLTANNEILVDDPATSNNQGVARAVINLDTGEKTMLDPSDLRYGVILSLADQPQVVSGGKWFRYSTKLSKVYIRDLVTNEETTISTTTYGYGAFLFEHNGYIHLPNTNYNYTRAYNIDTLEYVSSENIDFADLQLPADFAKYSQIYSLGISSKDGKYYITERSGEKNEYFDYDDKTPACLVCTDIKNVAGSLIDIKPFITSAAVYGVNNEDWFFDFNISSDTGYAITGENERYYPKYGVKYCKSSMSGNMLSFVELSSPVTKAEGDTMYISYGYKFV